MSIDTLAAPFSLRESQVAELAKFFPAVTPVRLPVNLTRLGGGEAEPEKVVIEFGTNREVLFCCAQRLDFADRVRLRNSDGSLDVEATVVAVQHRPGRTAVGVRFSGEVANWIVKP